jgi:sugar/nucleoside kinase (ribokinase family)
VTVPRVVVLGDLIYDLLARIESSVAFGTDTFAPIQAVPGGSGANAAAWLASLDVETHFVGRVGDDVLGDALAADLRKAGVKPHLARDASLGTGKVFVLVDGAGERTMITDRGAGDALGPEDVPEDLFDAGHLHLSGYTLLGDSRREAALKALRLARGAGMSVSVDPSTFPLLEAVGPERFLEWTRGADLCFPNFEEGALLSGEKDPDRVAEKMLDHYPAVILKLGAEGALYAGADGERLRLPAQPARVVDTTGAGDALSAGFLSAKLAGAPVEEALRKGIEIAARAVGRLGARPGSSGG